MDIDLYQYEALCVLATTSIIIVLIIAIVYSETHNSQLYRYIERLEEDNKRLSGKKKNDKDDSDNDNNKMVGWKYEYKQY